MAVQGDRDSSVVLDAKEDCRGDAKAFKGVNRARRAGNPEKSGKIPVEQSPSRSRLEVEEAS